MEEAEVTWLLLCPGRAVDSVKNVSIFIIVVIIIAQE